ncbi:MAG: ornithine cyclodeaminase family protein [Pirellulales bacterium]
MSILFLSEQDVETLADVGTAMEVVEQSFRRLAAGDADNVVRCRAHAPGIILHSMSAAASYLGRVGWKQYTTTRRGKAQFLVGILDSQSGDLEALIAADRLGQLRTGATTGVAVRHLAVPDADAVGLIGSGWQMRSQLAAICCAREVKLAKVFSRSAERREAFAKQMSSDLEIEVMPVGNPDEAVRGLPIVVTATTSKTPVFDGELVDPGATVCAVGSNALNRAEIDGQLIVKATTVACDDVDACRHEAGEFVEAVRAGWFDWRQAIGLGEVVGGTRTGRGNREEIIIFKSVGLGLEDLAVGSSLVDLARERGVGRPLTI